MRKYPFSDDVTVEALLRGDTPAAHPDMAPLAGAVAEIRATSPGTSPQPSAALAALLEHGLVDQGLSIDKGDLPATAASNASRPATQAFRLPKWRKKMIVEWIAGLGLAGKLGLGATVAAASVAGAGGAGVLPGPAQGTFNDVVSTATPWETEAEKKAAEIDEEEAAREEAEDAAEAAREAEEEAAEDAQDASDDSTDSPDSPDDAANDAADDAVDDARDAEEEAREQAQDAEEAAREQAEDADEQAREDAEDAADAAREQQREAARQAREQQEDEAERARDLEDRQRDDATDD